ncbi:MAG: DNA polymerase III subunit beta [Candidatus Moranbacteria bacterium]|nr:DNA polymerase III subunit beta [Candidatus Moranbacteria bacterium]
MKLICTQENLTQALNALDRVVGKQSSLPILSNFLFESENGRLKISATNLEIGIIVFVGAKIEKEGKFAVPARILSQFVQNLPQGEVLELELKDGQLLLKSGSSDMKIKVLDGKDFPIIPTFKKEYPVILLAQPIKQALSRLLFCASNNESRIELTGAQFLFEEKQLSIAATDSFRLAEEVLKYNQAKESILNGEESKSLIIPINTLQEISRSITPEVEELKVAIEEHQLFFEIDNVQIVSRIINGRFPDYKQIIPKEFLLRVALEKEALIRSLKIASTLSAYNTGEIALIFNPEEENCTVISKSQEIGENSSVLMGDFLKGAGPLTLIFNPRYLLEGLSAFSSKKIVFSANTSSSPATFEALEENEENKAEYVYVMMPIRKEYA